MKTSNKLWIDSVIASLAELAVAIQRAGSLRRAARVTSCNDKTAWRKGFFAASSLLAAGASFAAAPWHQDPYLLNAGGVPLDTATSQTKEQLSRPPKENTPGNFGGDYLGHAAVWWTDVSGRGVKDLVVGSFGGGFRIYRNEGTNAAPRFPASYEYLKSTDGKHAQVHIHCCIASNPRFVDLTDDGQPDLLSGNWFHGELSWWQGLGGGKFAPKQIVSANDGKPVLVNPLITKEDWMNGENFGAVGYPVDWFNDGRPAMLIGTVMGRLLVRRHTGTKEAPMFSNRNDFEILIDGKTAMDDGHASPIVVDWDGDGRWDIVSGSLSGSVYFFRNTGKEGAPEFKTREVIVEGGQAEQWVERGQFPRRGTRCYPQAVDFNGDGKLDLLLGDFCQSVTPREGLTPADEKQMRVLQARLEDVDRRAGFDQKDIRGRSRAYVFAADPKPNQELTALLEELAPYLQLYQLNRFKDLEPVCTHGQIWVYLRK